MCFRKKMRMNGINPFNWISLTNMMCACIVHVYVNISLVVVRVFCWVTLSKTSRPQTGEFAVHPQYLACVLVCLCTGLPAYWFACFTILDMCNQFIGFLTAHLMR